MRVVFELSSSNTRVYEQNYYFKVLFIELCQQRTHKNRLKSFTYETKPAYSL